MAFNSATTTISVTAFLTAAGRKKLFDSLETINEPFITKFGLGDSDANYGSIDAGFGTLLAGGVPESSELKPRIRSYALAEGSYKPAVPHIIVDGRYGGAEGHFFEFPIGDNQQTEQVYKIDTEWPKRDSFPEDYDITLHAAASSTFPAAQEIVSNAFTWDFQGKELKLIFLGNVDLATLQGIIGPDDETNNGWTLNFRIEGRESASVTVVSIDLVQ